MMFKRIGVIGCGLIGCSFAMAAKKAGIVERVVGYSKSPTTTEHAKDAGILDETAASALHAVSGSDLVLIAVPVSAMSKIFTDIYSLITPETLIMDVGSTKLDVVQAAQIHLKKKISNFVPAHPIAGKTSSGFRAAQADLFEKSKVILTPLDDTKQIHLEKAIKVWEAIGAKTQLMTANEHDEALAAVSHLPHFLAFCYMNAIMEQPNGEHFLSLAGSGFRDFTRIAAAEANMWRDVFLANKDEILLQVSTFKDMLLQYEQTLKNDDPNALLVLLKKASETRTAWSVGELPAGERRADMKSVAPSDNEASENESPSFLGRLFQSISSKSSE